MLIPMTSDCLRFALPGLWLCACATGPAAGPDPGPAATQAARRPADTIACQSGSFALQAPDGWSLDEQAGRANRMAAAFHPQHERWERVRAVLFVRCQPGPTSLAALVAEDKQRFRRLGSLMVTGEADPVRTRTGERIDVRTYSGGADGRNEAVAYLLLPGGAVRIVLRADSLSDFEAALPAFEALLGSFASGE